MLHLANIAEMDCLPFLCFFCANARYFWGVAPGEHCRDGLPAFFMFYYANARYFWGVAAGEHCRDGLPAFLCAFGANAQLFWGVAVMDCLHFIIWQECQLQHLMNFFLAGTLTAH